MLHNKDENVLSHVDKISELSVQKNLPVSAFNELNSETKSCIRINAKEFSFNLTPEWLLPLSHTIHLGTYSTPISIFKIQTINSTFIQKNDQQLLPFTTLLTIKFKNENEPSQYFLLTKDHQINNIIKKLMKEIPENNLELVLRKHYRSTIKPYESDFWSGIWGKNPGMEARYDNWIDFMTLKAYASHVISENKNQKLVVVDAGGGKGRLAKKLITATLKAHVNLDYFLIEPDSLQCEIAEKNLGPFKKLANIEIIKSTIEDFFTSDLAKQLKGNVNVVISSGGPINAFIVSIDEAERNMLNLREIMHPHGVFIAVGQTELLLKKKDLEKKYGFTVLNSAIRQVNEDPYDASEENIDLTQCYILKPK